MLFFCDATVLVHFYRAGRLSVLSALVGPNGQWTATVRRECRRSELRLNLPGLTAAAEQLLGEPLFPEDAENRRTRVLRRSMADPEEHRDKHLGEAETVTIMEARNLKAVFFTDDGGATVLASPHECRNTWEILRLAIKSRNGTLADAAAVRDSFTGAGGILPHEIRTEEGFHRFLNGDRHLLKTTPRRPGDEPPALTRTP